MEIKKYQFEINNEIITGSRSDLTDMGHGPKLTYSFYKGEKYIGGILVSGMKLHWDLVEEVKTKYTRYKLRKMADILDKIIGDQK